MTSPPQEEAARLVPAWVPWAPLLYLPLLALVSAILLLLAGWAVPTALNHSPSRTPAPSYLVLGWNPGGAVLADLGWLASDQGDLDRAAVFYRAAAADERQVAGYPADAAICLADLGRQAEAQSALREAQRRLRRYGSHNREAQREAFREVIRAVRLAERRRNSGTAPPEGAE